MINKQYAHKYCVITIREPSILPFVLIPNAYKTMTRYIEVNKIKRSHLNDGLTCYEQEYIKNGISYMDIYMTIDN